MTQTSETRHRARKDHVCDWCHDGIDAGTYYLRWRDFSFGAATIRMHPECESAMATCDDVRHDGFFTPGSYRRGCWCENGKDDCDCGIEDKKP